MATHPTSTPDLTSQGLAIVRLVATAVLAAVGLVAIVANPAIRVLEARLSAALTGLVTATKTVVVPETTSFYWDAGTPNMSGAEISVECTAAFGVAGILGAAAALVAGRRLRLGRVLTGTAVALAVVVAGNLGRMTFIAYAVHRWGGKTGYEWAHVIGGSVVTVVCMIGALAVLVLVSFSGRRPKEAGCTR